MCQVRWFDLWCFWVGSPLSAALVSHGLALVDPLLHFFVNSFYLPALSLLEFALWLPRFPSIPFYLKDEPLGRLIAFVANR